MSRKQNRKSKQRAAGDAVGAGQRKRRRRINTPSLIFIGLLVLGAAAVALASVLSGESPECPPGQVWSDAHNHCH